MNVTAVKLKSLASLLISFECPPVQTEGDIDIVQYFIDIYLLHADSSTALEVVVFYIYPWISTYTASPSKILSPGLCVRLKSIQFFPSLDYPFVSAIAMC